VKAWAGYALTAVVLTGVAGAIATQLVAEEAVRAVWVGALLALGVQLVAFGALVALRDRGSLFMVGWAGGMFLRFGAVGALAFWLSRTNALPRPAALISLVAFVFMLLLLEPIFLRRKLMLS
jgi:hypothetical protein